MVNIMKLQQLIKQSDMVAFQHKGDAKLTSNPVNPQDGPMIIYKDHFYIPLGNYYRLMPEARNYYPRSRE